MPKPQEINVPSKSGGFWKDVYRSIEITKSKLDPPTINPVDVLKDLDGNIVLDSNKNPFILGDEVSLDFLKVTSDEGLVSDNITCMIKDKKGNLWIATNGSGVSKYDGKSFTNFSMETGIVGNLVTSLCEDKNGAKNQRTYSKYESDNMGNESGKR